MKPAESMRDLAVEVMAHKARGDPRSPLASRRGSLVFGPFRLHLGSCRLFRDGMEVALRAQAFRVLAVLAQAAGEPVDYKRMAGGRHGSGAPVSRHTVAVTVVEVRKALLGIRFVDTVPAETRILFGNTENGAACNGSGNPGV